MFGRSEPPRRRRYDCMVSADLVRRRAAVVICNRCATTPGKTTLKPIKSPALLHDRHRHFVAIHPAATRPQVRSESASSAESQLLICPPIVCGFSPPSAFSASAKKRRAAVARPCPLFRRRDRLRQQFMPELASTRTPKSSLRAAQRRGERTPLACRFRRLAENLVPLTFSGGEES